MHPWNILLLYHKCRPAEKAETTTFFSIFEHQVWHKGIFQNGGENKQKTHYQEPFEGFDVGNLWKGGPGTTNQRCHGEYSGDPHGNPGSCLLTIHPETDPGQSHDQVTWKINLQKERRMRITNRYERKYESGHLVLDNNGYAYIRLISQKKEGFWRLSVKKNNKTLYSRNCNWFP